MGKNHHRRNRNRGIGDGHILSSANSGGIAAAQQITGPVGIVPPPDYIFKFRKNRIAPAQEIWGRENGTISYAPERAEYVKGKGNFVYYYGVPYPSKTVAPVEAINAINPVKRRFINTLRILSSREMIVPLFSLIFIGKKRRVWLMNRMCVCFNEEADMSVMPFYLDDEYYCPVAKEVRGFIKNILFSLGVEAETANKTAEIIGMMFEYDNAYRIRLQDVLSEASKENLMGDLPRELDRLLVLVLERDPNPTGIDFKFKSVVQVLKYAWRIPSLRKILREAIESADLDSCKMDEADIYHTCLYGSYNVAGRSLEERMAILTSYHGADQSKWPPRIQISQR